MKSLLERWLHGSKTVLLAALGLLATGWNVSAQCPIPDNLDGGPCCTLTQEKVPWFPKVAQNSLDICWRDCGIDMVGNCRAVWTPIKILSSTGPNCGYRLERLDLYDTTGVLKWSGTMRLLYSRTWLETDPTGVPLQVWRFLVNGDLRTTSALGTIPCPVPPCAPAFNGNVRFTGYIDFARTCIAASAPTQIAWMLTHTCDTIDHAPGFPRGGAFHPGRAYTFVGPAAGFVPAPVVATEFAGITPFEAMRRLRYPAAGTTGPIQCEFEERAINTLGPIGLFCQCATGLPFSMQWLVTQLNVNGACGSNVTTPGPFLPGYLSMGIGRWTVAATYPGVEDLRWNAGSYMDTDPCTGIVRPTVFFGVTTLGGYPAQSLTTGGVGPALPLNFIDQASSIRLGGGPVMNVPYLSDEVLNLNQ